MFSISRSHPTATFRIADILEITVSDEGKTSTAKVTVTVSDTTGSNTPPVAMAGSDKTAALGDTVFLSGVPLLSCIVR